MAKELSHDDSRAVDLFLDDGSSPGSSQVKSGKDHLRNRLNAAERVLRVLDQMPAPEPASDLVQRTMARVEEAARAAGHHAAAHRHPAVGVSRPQA